MDPGLVDTGYGVLERRSHGLEILATGVVNAGPRLSLEARLARIYEGILEVLEAFAPAVLVLEDLYAEYRFPRTAILMAHARGVICLAARQRGIVLMTLPPATVKRAIAASGAASKEQIQTVRPAYPQADAAAGPVPRRRCARPRPHGALTGGSALGVIATLSGRLRRKLEDRIILDVAGVGYEVYLPPTVMRQLERAEAGNGGQLDLVIYYHATRDQPRPVLIGFTADLDKEFFERLITVKDIGPMVAARALAVSIGEVASAISRQDEKFLRGLPGIGPQKAKNIVAQLQGKVAKFALAREDTLAPPARSSSVPIETDGLREMVWEVLVKQLGHRPSEASQLISDALKRRPELSTPEELFEEIYRASPPAARAAP